MCVEQQLERFDALLARLMQREGGPCPLRQRLEQPLPRAGVYFFFEPTPAGEPRLARVGTHGLRNGAQSTLKARLRQHLGTRTGNGNHRGSVFRLLVGDALIGRGDHSPVASWGVGSSLSEPAQRLNVDPGCLRAAEQPLETKVSDIIGAMPVLVLKIEDPPGPESLRGYIERNAIGLLSSPEAVALRPPPDDWLGRHSSRPQVRCSGLWNNRHVGEQHDPAFLETLEQLVG